MVQTGNLPGCCVRIRLPVPDDPVKGGVPPQPAELPFGIAPGFPLDVFRCLLAGDLTGERAVDKHDPLVIKLKDWVDSEYETGRVTTLSASEIEAKIKEFSGDRPRGF